VYCVFLFTSCSEVNQWQNDVVKQAWDASDHRDGAWLKRYINHENVEVRRASAQMAASFTDTSNSLAPILAEQINKETDKEVLNYLLFAAGQSRDTSLIPEIIKAYQLAETDTTKKICLNALAKIPSQQTSSSLDKLHKETNASDLFCEAWFYQNLHTPLSSYAFLSLWDFLGQSSHSGNSRFYALSAMLRTAEVATFNLDEIHKNASISKDLNELRLWPRFCIKFGSDLPKAFPLTIWNALDVNAKVNILAELQKKTYSSFSHSGIFNGLSDRSSAVREMAAMCVLIHAQKFSEKSIYDYFQKESDFKVRYLLASALLKSRYLLADEISNQIKREYLLSDNEYVKSEILKALANSFSNFQFIINETFSTPSILIQQAGYSALIEIRKSQNFEVYAKQWKEMNEDKPSLHIYFNSLFMRGLETKDIALLALTAEIMRDTTIPNLISKVNPLGFEDVLVLKQLRERLTLPRDIEIALELDKTIACLNGVKAPTKLKPIYNNPINWKLASRIPVNQRIRFSFLKGEVMVQLWPDIAPGTVSFIISLIQSGFYVGKSVHRVVPGFVAQGGCPRGDGWGSLESTLRSEFSSNSFHEGTIGMASAGPDTESCQWFITLSNTPHLNGRYTAFGRVEEGMEVVHGLRIGDRILNAELLP